MFKWLHHLFNPHCEFCRLERECKNCDMMREELAKERAEKMAVLNRLLETTIKPNEVIHEPPEGLKPIQIGRKHTPWDVRRAELEAQHKIKVEKVESQVGDIERLEKELGVSNG